MIQLLTVPEAAARLRVSRMGVYRLLQSNELESVVVGGSRRIPVDAVEAYVEQRRTERSGFRPSSRGGHRRTQQVSA